MARYVIASRRAGKFHEDEKTASRAALDRSFDLFAANVSVVNDYAPKDRLRRRVVVFDADEAEMTARQRDMPSDVILEPEILHWTDTAVPLEFRQLKHQTATGSGVTGKGAGLEIEVRGGGRPLVGATVDLFLRGPGNIQHRMESETDSSGVVAFSFAPFFKPLGFIATPVGEFWDQLVRGGRGRVTVVCPPLPRGQRLGWWHRTVGVNRYDPASGAGVKVGVIDSGVGPHGGLEHVVDRGAFIDGDHDPDGGADSGRHGTHVCGTIGARSEDDQRFVGIAPGVELYSARVFPPNGGANQGDIANAIDSLSKDSEADLINLSLGAPTGSQIERDAIQDALERGTLCICAAGNSSGPVEFPAAFEETVAVSAIGLLGWGPSGSQASLVVPSNPEKFADDSLYLADFSCFGSEIVCGGPGVGVISTVPSRHGYVDPYGPMNGTSMASPAACGALAALLGRDPEYLAMDRNIHRAEAARSRLRTAADDIGLKADFQGSGVAQAR